jgi:hypothetical protein
VVSQGGACLAEQVFVLIDADGSGDVDVEEFISSMEGDAGTPQTITLYFVRGLLSTTILVRLVRG